MTPAHALEADIACAAARVADHQRRLRQDTAVLKRQAWRYATSPAVVAVALSVVGVLAWMRLRK